jgi:lipopolysaccharide export system permease protein
MNIKIKIGIIDYYIGTTIATMILLVMLMLLGIDAFIEFTREFQDIGSGYYGLMQVLAYVPMTLPADIYQFFPMVGLLGCMLGLGLLASHSELIVMRASGMSITQITVVVLKTAVVLSVAMVLIGEVLAPFLRNKAVTYKAEAISGGQALLTSEGMWLKHQNNFIHIGKVLSDERLEKITRYVFNDQKQLQSIIFAESADCKDEQCTFNHVTQNDFSEDKVTTTVFGAQPLGIKLKLRLLNLTSENIEQKSLPELFHNIKQLKQNGINVVSYEFNFWQRLFLPLTTLVMIVLAIPFIFGPLRSATMGLRMLVGTMVGFGFYIFNLAVGSFSVMYQIVPFVAALLPTLLAAVTGWIILLYLRK